MAMAALPAKTEPVTVSAADTVSENVVRPPARGWAAMGETLTNQPYRLLIGGSWVEGSGGSYGVVNPATEEVVSEAPEAGIKDAEAAAAAAKEALPAWSQTPREERARLLQAVADRVRERQQDLLPLIIADTGATLSVRSALQVPMCANRFERYARRAMQDIDLPIAPQPIQATPLAPGGLIGAVAKRQPVGVVA